MFQVRKLIFSNDIDEAISPATILHRAIVAAKSRYRRPFMTRSGLENVIVSRLKAKRYRLPLPRKARVGARLPRKLTV